MRSRKRRVSNRRWRWRSATRKNLPWAARPKSRGDRSNRTRLLAHRKYSGIALADRTKRLSAGLWRQFPGWRCRLETHPAREHPARIEAPSLQPAPALLAERTSVVYIPAPTEARHSMPPIAREPVWTEKLQSGRQAERPPPEKRPGRWRPTRSSRERR